MFDFAWSEILMIGAVALIAIGPKDMPAAIRTMSGMIKKARRMAGEFQTHVDEMVRDADLGDVKKAFNDIRNLDFVSAIEKHVDPDRTLRDTFSDNPLAEGYSTSSSVSTLDEVLVREQPVLEPLSAPPSEPAKPLAPAFIPPNLVPPLIAGENPADEVPSFIPPEVVLQRRPPA
jgi:sec-independent protein translocase protein TatB